MDEVLGLAVTHTPPRGEADAVPFPAEEKRRIGLDEAPSWIVTTEANVFVWPGPDVRPVPERSPTSLVYGYVSDTLLQRVARSFLANRERQRLRTVNRST